MGSGKFIRTAASLILFLLVECLYPVPSAAQEPSFWQLTLKFQISGQYQSAASELPGGTYNLEIDWLGFLEEDGLDFIIYHLSAFPVRWELSAKKGNNREESLSALIPAPLLRLDYVEGQEEMINFYFSLDSLAVPYDPDSQSVKSEKIKLLMPQIPWKQKQPEGLNSKSRISGKKAISIPRAQLKQDELQRNFSWEEEIAWSQPGSTSLVQKSQLKIALHLVKCYLWPKLRLWDESGRRPALNAPG